MTVEEALLYLPEKEDESVEDRFEEALFEVKQFLNARTPVSKLVSGKIKKLRRIEEAFVALGGDLSQEVSPSSPAPITGSTVRDFFDAYTREKGRVKLQLLSRKNVDGMESDINRLIELTKQYAHPWSVVDVSDLPDVTIVNEPDPMEIYSAIREMEENGWSSFTEINLLDVNSPLKTEAKRLSLWLKFEDDGR